jgi:putative methionine-R-sulfoxide reductase with GAF domain
MTDADLVEDVRREAGADGAAEERAGRAAELIRARTGRRWVGIYQLKGSEGQKPRLERTGRARLPHLPDRTGLTAAAIRSRGTVVSNDVASDPRYLTN